MRSSDPENADRAQWDTRLVEGCFGKWQPRDICAQWMSMRVCSMCLHTHMCIHLLDTFRYSRSKGSIKIVAMATAAATTQGVFWTAKGRGRYFASRTWQGSIFETSTSKTGKKAAWGKGSLCLAQKGSSSVNNRFAVYNARTLVNFSSPRVEECWRREGGREGGTSFLLPSPWSVDGPSSLIARIVMMKIAAHSFLSSCGRWPTVHPAIPLKMVVLCTWTKFIPWGRSTSDFSTI